MEEDKKADPRFARSDVPKHELKSTDYARGPADLPVAVHEPPRAITAEERKFDAYKTLRAAWQWDKDAGKRAVEAAKVRGVQPSRNQF